MKSFSLVCAIGALTLAACGEPPLELEVAANCNPLATSGECLFPYPSRFFQAPDATRVTGVTNAFHEDSLNLPPSAPAVDYRAFNLADGHPPSAPLLVHLGVDVDATQLITRSDIARSQMAGEPIAVIDMSTGERVPLITEMDQTLRDSRNAGRHALILRPVVAMEMGARYVAVMTRSLRASDGAPLPVSPGFEALRDKVITDHAALEASRDDYEEIFAFLEGEGYAREDLFLAWDFYVASEEWTLGGIVSMRDQALAVAAEGTLGYTITNIEETPNANTYRIVEGTFEVPTFLDETNDIERTADGGAVLREERQSFPFTMVIPQRAASGDPLPLVMFGHGVFGTGREYLTGGLGEDFIQPLAESAGAILVATDWIGLSSADQDLLVTELVADINRINVVTDRLQQSLINNLVLTELVRDVIQADERVRITDAPLLTDDVFYYGVSLGGIQGASFVSLSPRITRAVLAVPGAAWSSLLTRSVVYSPVQQLVDVRYPDALLQTTFIASVQGRFDGADGINVGRFMFREPLAGSPNRTVILQEAIGDCQVPNLATEMLARTLGVGLLEPSYEPIFGVRSISAPTTESVVHQIELPDALALYTPPETNVLPESDNGTHSNSVALDSAIAQVIALLSTGQVTQPCDGACDPD